MDINNTYAVWFWRNGETRPQQAVDADSGGLGPYAAVEAATGEKCEFLAREGRSKFWSGRTASYIVEVQR